MDDKTKVLQVGCESWEPFLVDRYASHLEWTFWDLEAQDKVSQDKLIKKMGRDVFDVVLCTDRLDEAALEPFFSLIEAHRLILSKEFETSASQFLKSSKCPLFMDFNPQSDVLDVLCDSFYSEKFSAGLKLPFNRVRVQPHFTGTVTYKGAHRLLLEGDFSSVQDEALLSWTYSIVGYRYLLCKSVQIWLEYERSGNAEISLSLLEMGHYGEIVRRHHYSEAEIQDGLIIPYDSNVADFSLSLFAEGSGSISIGALHYRNERHGYGDFFVGAGRVVDRHREELFYYFHPGNLKPPLNVYFSGYKPSEGFEGFYMMKSLGHPFLLVTDTRLEGGSFYLGSEELEQKLTGVIQEYLFKLNFSSQELILSGLSMGTFGALYYASFLSPYAVIVGKPLINLGDVAKNGKLLRPGAFATSFDLVGAVVGEFSKDATTQLNARFWERFSQNNFEKTQFVLAHMLHDDYDDKAYQDLLDALSEKPSRVIGKGLPGRHNDDTNGVVQWFVGQYKRLIHEGFREEKDEL